MSVSELKQMLQELIDDRLDVKFKPLRRQFEDRMIGVKEVCEKLGVTRQTLVNLEKRKELIPLRIGSKIQYSESAVTAYLNQKRIL